MHNSFLITGLFLTVLLAGCGGSSSSDDDNADTDTGNEIPVAVSIDNLSLSAGVPTAVTYTIPAPDKPYTEISIDLAATLEAAEITVTP